MAPRDNAKKSGDIHPPDVELEPPFQEGMTDAVGADGTPRDRGKAADETSDSDHNTRNSGEGASRNKS
jgi:hypothetical protein